MSKVRKSTQTKLRVLMSGIFEYQSKKGSPPTFREMSSLMGGISTNTVEHYIKAMEYLGWVERDRGVSRLIRITREGFMEIKVSLCPLCGSPTANHAPILANTDLFPPSSL